MTITEHNCQAFADYLRSEERSAGTIEKYLRDVRSFARWLDRRTLTRENAAAWRDALLARRCAPTTINSMLSALNRFLRFLGREDYRRLLDAAGERGQKRLALLMETICSTGIRVSEVRWITLEAARQGRAEISLKGKIRTILLPAKLCRKLLKYAKERKIASGEIFLTGSGKSLSRRQIWREMKQLCALAGVEESKVFPHNLRHLFATVFYRACRDIVKLADVLGHSSVNTTRIYLLTTGAEHARQLEKLGLVT